MSDSKFKPGDFVRFVKSSVAPVTHPSLGKVFKVVGPELARGPMLLGFTQYSGNKPTATYVSGDEVEVVNDFRAGDRVRIVCCEDCSPDKLKLKGQVFRIAKIIGANTMHVLSRGGPAATFKDDANLAFGEWNAHELEHVGEEDEVAKVDETKTKEEVKPVSKITQTLKFKPDDEVEVVSGLPAEFNGPEHKDWAKGVLALQGKRFKLKRYDASRINCRGWEVTDLAEGWSPGWILPEECLKEALVRWKAGDYVRVDCSAENGWVGETTKNHGKVFRVKSVTNYHSPTPISNHLVTSIQPRYQTQSVELEGEDGGHAGSFADFWLKKPGKFRKGDRARIVSFGPDDCYHGSSKVGDIVEVTELCGIGEINCMSESVVGASGTYKWGFWSEPGQPATGYGGTLEHAGQAKLTSKPSQKVTPEPEKPKLAPVAASCSCGVEALKTALDTLKQQIEVKDKKITNLDSEIDTLKSQLTNERDNVKLRTVERDEAVKLRNEQIKVAASLEGARKGAENDLAFANMEIEKLKAKLPKPVLTRPSLLSRAWAWAFCEREVKSEPITWQTNHGFNVTTTPTRILPPRVVSFCMAIIAVLLWLPRKVKLLATRQAAFWRGQWDRSFMIHCYDAQRFWGYRNALQWVWPKIMLLFGVTAFGLGIYTEIVERSYQREADAIQVRPGPTLDDPRERAWWERVQAERAGRKPKRWM